MKKNYKWTKEQIDFLKKHKFDSVNDVAPNLPDKAKKDIQNKLYVLRLGREIIDFDEIKRKRNCKNYNLKETQKIGYNEDIGWCYCKKGSNRKCNPDECEFYEEIK